MEYRQLPHGTEREKFGVLGLGLGGIGKTPADEIEAIIRKALDHGINYFDLCTAGATYAPFGRAIAGKRDRVFIQVHFGAVYDENGEYGWCRDFDTIQKTFLWELETLGTDYVDFGFLHCVDFFRSGQYRMAQNSIDLDSLILPAEGTPEEAYMDRQQREQCLQALSELPFQMQQILRLKYFSQQTFREIAQALSLPEGTVKTQYYKAIAILRTKEI